ncbi:kinase [Rhizorhabdus argentea]|uniref:kinase n=1 Tax=Rhizorhabdus argentea TaxID=1387174 RepID=UPI003BF50E6E
MSPEPRRVLDAALAAISQTLARDGVRRPLVIGLCGAQGSGKSTLAARLASGCEDDGISTAILSIDDLYRTRAEREVLARQVHPLLRTRGVPGTHDIDLGLSLFESLDRGRAVALPRFDKAADDRAAKACWGRAAANTDVLIFEGWCVGARPEPPAALAQPVNALERDEDPDGIWRRFVNEALAGAYQKLFARIDLLLLLAAPSFAIVRDWRIEQERDLRASAAVDAKGVMSDADVSRFVQHYERLTRHILVEMPARADLVAMLGEDRRPLNIIQEKGRVRCEQGKGGAHPV